MTKRVLVTSHCQSGPLAASMSLLFDGLMVEALPLTNLPDEDDLVASVVGEFDVWVTSQRSHILEGVSSTTVVVCLEWNIRVFQPDIAYVVNLASGTSLQHAQISRIAAWAFNAGCSVEEAERLYCSEIFLALGCFDRWDQERDGLRSYFEDCGLDFVPFYQAIRRKGVFMHDPGHPFAFVLMELAKAIARKLEWRTVPHPGKLPEAWEHLTWPVYPEIASRLGFEGSYTWCEGGPIQGGLRGYLTHAFQRLEREGVAPGLVGLTTSTGIVNVANLLDTTLLPIAGTLQ